MLDVATLGLHSLQVEALDLYPGAPRIDPRVRKEFESFKESKARQACVHVFRVLIQHSNGLTPV